MTHEIYIKSGTPKEAMQSVSKILKAHPGEHQVSIAIESGNNLKRIILPYKVDFTPQLDEEVAKILRGW